MTALAAKSNLTRMEIGQHAKEHLIVSPLVIYMPAAVGGPDIAARTDFSSQAR
jgi:hypothetical protein